MTAAPLDDLTETADALAAVLGAPVLVCDADFAVVAYSSDRTVASLSDPAARLRVAAVMSRRLPREAVRGIVRTGTDRRVIADDHARRVEIDGGVHVVSGIRVGEETLGHLWVCGLDPDASGGGDAARRAGIVRDGAARLAQGLLWRRRAAAHADGVRAPLTVALHERGAAEELLRAWSAGRRLVVVDTVSTVVLTTVTARMIETMCALEVEGSGAGVVATQGTRVYALVADEGRSAARAVGERLAECVAACTGVAARGVYTRPIVDGRELVDLRARSESHLLAQDRSGLAVVRGLEDSTSAEDLGVVLGVFADRPELLHPGLRTLAEHDRGTHADLVRTLHVFLESHCESAVASRVLAIHRNTLKYRLGRIRQISGIDLDEPAERLLVELQLRFLRDRAASSVAATARPIEPWDLSVVRESPRRAG